MLNLIIVSVFESSMYSHFIKLNGGNWNMKKLTGIDLNSVRVGKIMQGNFNNQILPCIVLEVEKYDNEECALNVKVSTHHGKTYITETDLSDLSVETSKKFSDTILEWEMLGKGSRSNFNSNLSLFENRRLK